VSRISRGPTRCCGPVAHYTNALVTLDRSGPERAPVVVSIPRLRCVTPGGQRTNDPDLSEFLHTSSVIDSPPVVAHEIVA